MSFSNIFAGTGVGSSLRIARQLYIASKTPISSATARSPNCA